jgi:hypothetical protein
VKNQVNVKLPWKRRFLRVPERVSTRIARSTRDEFVVGCVKKIPVADLDAGMYRHLRIQLGPTCPEYPSMIVPPRTVGRTSQQNVDGLVIVRKDLPMTWKTYTFETPNWGDGSTYGYHDVDINRQVYRRDFVSPQEFALSITLMGEEPEPDRRFVFKFLVETSLNRKKADFEGDLLFALNLLQENVGAADVFPVDATADDYLRTVYVDWEILPPGERDQNIARILSGIRAPSEQDRAKLVDRYDFMAKLKPVTFIAGRSGFRRYFGAQFDERLVAFENLEYGNALYVMFDTWEKLSQRSRLELLSGERDGFVRIVHEKGWKDKLSTLIKKRRSKD